MISTLVTLFIEFFKTGLFAIGGGLATLPFLYDMADKYPWFDRAMLVDMIAVAESTPGPIGINTATYAGFNAAGIVGGVVATFGLVLPSYIVIVIIAKFLSKFAQSPVVKSAFYGLRPAVTGMIAAAGLSVARTALLTDMIPSSFDGLLYLFDWPAIVLFVVLWILYKKFNLHPIFYIAAAAVVGIVIGM